jgi:hypothetical protein
MNYARTVPSKVDDPSKNIQIRTSKETSVLNGLIPEVMAWSENRIMRRTPVSPLYDFTGRVRAVGFQGGGAIHISAFKTLKT